MSTTQKNILIETNEGTFSGDPAFATRRVYRRADGSVYATGPEEAEAPGYMRKINNNKDILIETNEGTFSALEAARKIGTGDPAFATRRVYRRADGSVYATGPEEAEAPGYMRKINRA